MLIAIADIDGKRRVVVGIIRIMRYEEQQIVFRK